MSPTPFFPVALGCVIASFYFIGLGYTQIERGGYWFGVLVFLLGVSLASFGPFAFILGPMILEMLLH
jgi:hypothetical protein